MALMFNKYDFTNTGNLETTYAKYELRSFIQQLLGEQQSHV